VEAGGDAVVVGNEVDIVDLAIDGKKFFIRHRFRLFKKKFFFYRLDSKASKVFYFFFRSRLLSWI
jgi:hypothetical protein